jgi:hypothetical protein
MVYNTQNYWILGIFHRPVFKRLENTTFRKLDLFSSSGEVGRHILSWVPWKELTSITGPVIENLMLGPMIGVSSF